MMQQNYETYNFENALSVEERDAMIMESLLGSLEDLATEFDTEIRTRNDDEILAAVQGVYDYTSDYFDNDFAQTIELFNVYNERLSLMNRQCNHDHFGEQALKERYQQNQSPENDKRHHHDHNHDDDEDDDTKPKKKKKKSKFSLY